MNSAEGILVCNDKDRVLFCNPAFSELIDLDLHSERVKLHPYLPPPKLHKVVEDIEQVLKTQKPKRGDCSS